ncbi:MAG: hypothetical protein EOP87_19325, partial [Verrucomicrobiaceae bacterium]
MTATEFKLLLFLCERSGKPQDRNDLLRSLETGEPVQSRVVFSQQTSPRGDLENRGFNAWII